MKHSEPIKALLEPYFSGYELGRNGFHFAIIVFLKNLIYHGQIHYSIT
jgi:hypothetical protein